MVSQCGRRDTLLRRSATASTPLSCFEVVHRSDWSPSLAGEHLRPRTWERTGGERVSEAEAQTSSWLLVVHSRRREAPVTIPQPSLGNLSP